MISAVTIASCQSIGEQQTDLTSNISEGASKPNKVDIFYVTDRGAIFSETGKLTYDASRSHSLAYGIVSVIRNQSTEFGLNEPIEIGRFPRTPYAMQETPMGVRRADDAILAHERSVFEIQKELGKKLNSTKRKEVIIFIHGYHNTFDDAIKSTSQLCDSFRVDEYVCISLSWPAGGTQGILLGYNFDRESGEFAVADIRKAIRVISGTQQLKHIHLIAHSRGTDVLASALQQLMIEAYGSKQTIGDKYKIANIILAAPDIDVDVASSKLAVLLSDPDFSYGGKINQKAILNRGNTQTTIYTSQGDKALAISNKLFGGQFRLGMLAAHLDDRILENTPKVGNNLDLISVESDGGEFLGHSYFLANNHVKNDIVSLIRDHQKAGSPERQLIEIKKPFWFLPQ
jgi:esterase/lipase superfamily enzyme